MCVNGGLLRTVVDILLKSPIRALIVCRRPMPYCRANSLFLSVADRFRVAGVLAKRAERRSAELIGTLDACS